MISQNVTSSWGGRRKLPYAFTEHGALMLGNVLKSDRAVEVSLMVVRTFVHLRELVTGNKQNVSLHAANVLKEGELVEGSVVKESLTTASDGKKYRTKLYRLEMILAVGYRVKGLRGTQFRQWATAHLAEYLVKGFVMDDERLKNPKGWDYFDELLARIREIRAPSPRRPPNKNPPYGKYGGFVFGR